MSLAVVHGTRMLPGRTARQRKRQRYSQAQTYPECAVRIQSVHFCEALQLSRTSRNGPEAIALPNDVARDIHAVNSSFNLSRSADPPCRRPEGRSVSGSCGLTALCSAHTRRRARPADSQAHAASNERTSGRCCRFLDASPEDPLTVTTIIAKTSMTAANQI